MSFQFLAGGGKEGEGERRGEEGGEKEARKGEGVGEEQRVTDRQ